MTHNPLRLVPLWLLGLLLGTVFAFAQAPKSQMEYFRDPGVPETFVVRPSVKDTALVCAEPDKGLVTCKTVGEFRAWVRERPMVKK
jgi:hypothetical protein